MEMERKFAEGFVAARIIGHLDKVYATVLDQHLVCPCCNKRLEDVAHDRVEKHSAGLVAFLTCDKCDHKTPTAFHKNAPAAFIECDEAMANELLPVLKSAVFGYDYDYDYEYP
jgi:hypothetical protein